MKNPFHQPAHLWQGTFTLHQTAVPALESLFDDELVSAADFELDEKAGTRTATLIWPRAIERDEIEARLSGLREAAGYDIRLIDVAPLAARDWVGEVKRSFPPLSIGDFHIHGSHVECRPPHGRTALLIDANAAFGTGEHETTKGCLLALGDLARRRPPVSVLDMGCGSAILAMAAAKRYRVPALGVEIDPVSVAVAKENVRLNGLGGDVRVVVGNGYAAPEVRRHGPFDLIFANILARPLVAMAPALAKHLAPGGTAILSGLLDRQENLVLQAHRHQGLVFRRRYALGAWRALVVGKDGS